MYTLRFRKTELAPELSITIEKEKLDAYINKYAHYYHVKVYDEAGNYLMDKSHLSYPALRSIGKSSHYVKNSQEAARTLNNIMNNILKTGAPLGMKLTDEEKSLVALLGGNGDDKER